MTDYREQCAERLARALENPSGGRPAMMRPREGDAALCGLIRLAFALARAMRHPVPCDPTFKARLRDSLLAGSNRHWTCPPR